MKFYADKYYVVFVIILIVSIMVGGCGGGVPGHPPVNTTPENTGRVVFQIQWPERKLLSSRDLPAVVDTVRLIVRRGTNILQNRTVKREPYRDFATVEVGQLPLDDLSFDVTAFRGAAANVILARGSVEKSGENRIKPRFNSIHVNLENNTKTIGISSFTGSGGIGSDGILELYIPNSGTYEDQRATFYALAQTIGGTLYSSEDEPVNGFYIDGPYVDGYAPAAFIDEKTGLITVQNSFGIGEYTFRIVQQGSFLRYNGDGQLVNYAPALTVRVIKQAN